MDSNQYVNLARRTNAAPAQLANNMDEIVATLQLMQHSAEVVDAIKKQSFYNRSINSLTVNHHIEEAIKALRSIQNLLAAPGRIQYEDGIPVSVSLQKNDVPFVIDAFHGAVGVFSEAGELAEALLKGIDTNQYDYVNFAEEFGDVMWYVAVGVSGVGGDLGQIMQNNIDKLAKRYPDKYSDDYANNRDLVAERKILEQVDLGVQKSE